MFLILVIFVIFIHSSCALHEKEIDVTVDFLKFQYAPTKVNLLLCWKKDELQNLMKDLNRIGFLVSESDGKRIEIFKPAEHQLYILDMDCEDSEKILNVAYKNNLLNAPYRWIIFNSNSTTFNNIYIQLSSRIYLFKATKNKYSIQSIYQTQENKPIINNDITLWNNGHFEYYNQIIDNKNRSNLMKMDMNISLVVMYENTMKHLEDMRERRYDALTKLNYILSNHISDYININKFYVYRNTWGSVNTTTGVYNGEIGDVQLGTAELGSTSAFITKDRVALVDFIAYTAPTKAKFVFRAPHLSAVSNLFILPFDKHVWAALLVVLTIIFVVVYIIIKWEWSDKTNRENLLQQNSLLKPTMLDVIQMEIGAICQQGSESEPKSIAGSIATFFIFLTLMFLYTSYAANVVALLQSTSKNMQNLESLLNSNIKLGVEETPYSKYYITTTTGKIQKEIYDKKIANKPENFMSVAVGVDKIRNDFFAFHAETDTIYKEMSNTFLETEKCGLVEIEYWSVGIPFVPIKKNSAYKELLRIGYRKLDENGLQNRNYRRMYTKKPMCQNQGANFVSVSLDDCYFALLSYGFGVSASILVFVIEIIVYKVKKNDTILFMN